MLPGITPSSDQFGELVPECNRMMGEFNLDGHKIFTTNIATYPLTTSKKTYTIGPGGDFNTARPVYIRDADFLFPTTPTVRRSIRIMEDAHEWSKIAVQDISGAPPWYLYYDSGYAGAGLGTIYISPQPPATYSIELYTWQGLISSFASTTDAVLLPPGYESAIVTNLGVRAAALYPRDSMLHPLAVTNAQKALRAVTTLNSRSPKLTSEAMNLGGSGRSGGDVTSIITGGGSSTGGSNLQRFILTGLVNGTNGSDGNAVFTCNVTPKYLQLFVDRLRVTPGVAYTLSGPTITFLAPNIPRSGDSLLAEGTV